MNEVRLFLTKYNTEKGYGTDDDDLIETLIEGNRVHTSGRDEHRWYICENAVNEIDGVYIAFTDYLITGDNSMSDMDLDYDLDSAEIVERKERQVTEVYFE